MLTEQALLKLELRLLYNVNVKLKKVEEGLKVICLSIEKYNNNQKIISRKARWKRK